LRINVYVSPLNHISKPAIIHRVIEREKASCWICLELETTQKLKDAFVYGLYDGFLVRIGILLDSM